MLWVLIVTVASASARRISTDVHDHYLAQPKTDFGSFGDGRFEVFGDGDAKDIRDVKDSGDRNVNTEFSSRSFGERHKPGNPEFHEYSSFNTHFKHHHFRHSSDGRGDSRDFGSQNRGFGSGFTGQSEFRNRGRNEHNHRDIENGFRQNTDETRTHGIETLGHEFGSETFGSDRRQHAFDRGIESHNHRSIGQDSGSQGSSDGFHSNFGSDNFGSHSFQGRSIEHNNQKNSNNRFDQNTNAQRTDQSHGSENADRHTELQAGSAGGHTRTDVNSQNNKNKEEFEIISAAHKRSFDNHNKENVNIRTPDHDCEKITKTEIKNTSNIVKDKVEHNENTGTKPNTNITTERRSNSGSGSAQNSSSSRSNQKPDVKTPIENEVTNNSRRIPAVANKNRTNQGKEAEEDRWVWGEVTTIKLDLENRDAFNGDRCPTGKIKIGNLCVDVD